MKYARNWKILGFLSTSEVVEKMHPIRKPFVSVITSIPVTFQITFQIMMRTLFLIAVLCATLFHADAASNLRRLRSADGDEINAKYMDLASDATGADLIHQRRVMREQREKELEARELGASPVPEPAYSMSMSASMSMSM
jgi:hypothetical protein